MNKLIIFLTQIILAFTLNAQDITKYTTTNLNMRFRADSLSKVLTVIPKGTPITIAEDCDCNWIPVVYKVRLDMFLQNTYPKKNLLLVLKVK